MIGVKNGGAVFPGHFMALGLCTQD